MSSFLDNYKFPRLLLAWSDNNFFIHYNYLTYLTSVYNFTDQIVMNCCHLSISNHMVSLLVKT